MKKIQAVSKERLAKTVNSVRLRKTLIETAEFFSGHSTFMDMSAEGNKDGDYSDFQFSGGVWFGDEGRNLEEEKTFYENRLDEVERELGEAERYIFDYDQSDEFVSEIEKISKEGGEQYSRFGGGDWEDLWRDMYEDFCNNL